MKIMLIVALDLAELLILKKSQKPLVLVNKKLSFETLLLPELRSAKE